MAPARGGPASLGRPGTSDTSSRGPSELCLWARRKPIGNVRGPPVSREWPIGTSTFGSALGASPAGRGRSDRGELLRVLLEMADDEAVGQRVDPQLAPGGVHAHSFGVACSQRFEAM